MSATGTIYEMLVVIDNPEWDGPIGDSIQAYLGADMPCMPQMESYFSIMHSPWAVYDAALKSTRNILLIDINPDKYTQARIHYKKDVYSHPQALAQITAPTVEDMQEFWGKNGLQIRDWFVGQEIERQAEFYRSFCNHDADVLLQKKWGISMKVPADYQLIMEDDNFVWFCNPSGPKRRDLVIYTYPYRDANTFTMDYLCAKRDTMLHRIGGTIEGSYMGIEYKHFPPQLRPITRYGQYCAELRGLWKLMDGEAMGGPFVQHSRVDEINHRIVTAEAYIFAPGQKKRNAYRQAEAILYTLQLQQDVNILQEVNVVANKESQED